MKLPLTKEFIDKMIEKDGELFISEYDDFQEETKYMLVKTHDDVKKMIQIQKDHFGVFISVTEKQHAIYVMMDYYYSKKK